LSSSSIRCATSAATFKGEWRKSEKGAYVDVLERHEVADDGRWVVGALDRVQDGQLQVDRQQHPRDLRRTLSDDKGERCELCGEDDVATTTWQ
jgi:hypothetical protein